jgi:F420-dependent oxidoreductase-like protein
MTRIRFGFNLANLAYNVRPAALAPTIFDLTDATEQGGFDSMWVADHVHQNDYGGGPSRPMFEAYTLLSAMAARTTEIRLGALVSPVMFRNPALLAKTVATLDVLSGGRAVLGIGAGWFRPEYEAYGMPFPDSDERWDRLEEAIQVCRAMLTAEEANFTGRYYTVTDAWNSPRPIQPKVPILIGGSGPKRTLPLIAKYADECNIKRLGSAEAVADRLTILRQQCEDIGRDFDEIGKSAVLFTPDDEDVDELCRLVDSYLSIGVGGVILLAWTCPTPATIMSWGNALRKRFG